MVTASLRDLLDQSQPFGRLAVVHTLFSGASTLVTISLAGSLFFSVSPHQSKDKVLLYLVLTIAPFAVVAPGLSPLLDRGTTARRAGIAVACGGSALLALSMSGHLKGLLLFPEAFGILVLSKLYLVGKAAVIPTMTNGDDDLASANAKLAVLAALAGFAVSPIGVAFLQLGAPWVLRLDFVVFLAAAVAAIRLPKTRTLPGPVEPMGVTEDGRPLHGPARPAPLPPPEPLPGGPGGLIYGRRAGGAAGGRAGARPGAGAGAAAGAGPAAGSGSGSGSGSGGHSGAGSGPGSGSGRNGRLSVSELLDRRSRVDVRAERQRLGLPLFVPEVTVALLGTTVLRAAFGFMTFFLAFALRDLRAPTWWYGAVILASGVGGILGSMLVPTLRRSLSEQQIIATALLAVAMAGLLAGWGGSLVVQPLLAFVVGWGTTGAKPAFDSIVQRYVPPAALGRAFARFETQLQLAWVVCGVIAVVIGFSLRSGDILIATACAVAAVFHFSLRRSLGRAERVPSTRESRAAARAARSSPRGRGRHSPGRVMSGG